MNNYITWESLKCPPKQLECILEKLICNLQCKPETTFTGTFAGGVLTLNVNGVATSITLPDLDNQSLSLSGNILTISNGNTVDLTPFANITETVTTITDTVAGNKIATYTNELGASVDINESISIIENNGDGTATFTNEAGVTTTFPIGGVTAVDNGDGTYTLTLADGSTVTISNIITPLVDNGNGTFTYTDEAGVSTTFTQGVAETVTSITNTVAGSKIADYTNETGTVVTINETITALGTPTLGAGNILTIPFVNELGIIQTVTVDLSSLITVDVQLNTATYDAANNVITLLETNGDTQTINLSEFSVIATTNLDGSITISQEGVTKFIIPAPIAATALTNNAAPFSFNATTQSGNIPQVPSIVNGELVQGDGTPPEQIPDFWRVGRGATGALPDGVNDDTEKIGHQSDIYVGADALVTVGHGGGDVANNTALGNFTLNSNTTGINNTAIGVYSLLLNTTGGFNTASGANSLLNNKTGASNTASGVDSLRSNTTGIDNTASGVGSLHSNITGRFNTASGVDSLRSNTIAINNTASGVDSLYYNQENENTAIGSNSFNSYNLLLFGATMTASTLTQVTLSSPMIPSPAVGSYLTLVNVTGYTNTISGLAMPKSYRVINDTTLEVTDTSQVLGTTGTATNFEIRQSLGYTNSSALGYDAQPTASNQVMLGNTAVTEVRTSGAYFGTAFNIVSDKRNKYVGDVVTTKELYGTKINVYEYQLILDGTWHIGVLAQDVREIETKRGKFILTNTSEGVNYGATIESFNAKLGSSYKFFSEINKDAEIIKEQLLEQQGITKEEADKIKEIYDTIIRESQEYILDEEGNPTDKIVYDGRFDKEVKKNKDKEIDADKLYNSLIVVEKDMLSLSTQINVLL